ncbi:MAG TPA: catalase HPII [Alphaproteobacteria bacterium]|nr:catalase HPII [Alphaproteobacteria bacterium]
MSKNAKKNAGRNKTGVSPERKSKTNSASSYDGKTRQGAGGETHQITANHETTLTSQQGVPIADDQNSLKAGMRGPTLMEDHLMREKIFHFDHERIPERVVHARGYGARGYFELTNPIPEFSRADLFQRKGEKTPVFCRFSTVAGSKGSPDLARDVRGFAVKFYTNEGNWDLVGNNIPVFFIQDAIKFPDLIHSVKPAPDRGFPQAQSAHDNFWDFISLMPESIHMALWVMSDRAIPRSFRFMEGFGVHTFRLVNKKGESHFVKFHWKPKQGLQSVVWDEAVKINGADPDFHRRDLWAAIESGDYPEWELGVQVFDDTFAENFEFDVLDPTKLIPEEQVPVRKIGRMVLDNNVDNFFAETEQVAFCTQNIVPGIDFSNDPLLQGRNFSYLDTQLKRLGSPNFTHIPVNAPRCPIRHFQQDGHMAMKNPTGRANYEPNSWGEGAGPRENPDSGFISYGTQIEGEKVRARPESFDDHYSQARQFYVSQTKTEQRHIVDAFVFELSKVQRMEIRERVVSHLRNVDQQLAADVAKRLGIDKLPKAAKPARQPLDDLPASDALSILKNSPDDFAGRKLGIYVTEGGDAAIVEALEKATKKKGMMSEIIAPFVAGVTLSDGKLKQADQVINGAPSVLYDFIAIVFGEENAADLANDKASRDFIDDAWAHSKFIGYTQPAEPLLEAVGLTGKGCPGLVRIGAGKDAATLLSGAHGLRCWSRFE